MKKKKDIPHFTREQCPNDLVKWMDRRMEDRDELILSRLEEMLEPVEKLATMSMNNRTMVYFMMLWLTILTGFLIV